MIDRRSALIQFAAGALFVAVPALAMEKKPFDAAAFSKAQASGAPILVEVTAPWCPVCKAQAPIIRSVAAKREFAKLVVFEVDFDSRKDVLRQLNVQRQSTLILFKGAAEAGRSTGDTDPAAIEALMRKAI
jgi:thioredoxin 1